LSAGFLYLFLLLIPILGIDLYAEYASEEYPTQHATFTWQFAAAAAALVLIAFVSAYQASPFVYFQF
jgi:hypothetical protein